MRGKRQNAVGDLDDFRIIPAHAGQTTIFLFNSARWSDHPRACGANPCRPPIRWMNTGSSPRMRGKLGHRHRRYGRARIIPAHAGQTRPRPRTPVSPTDHPRACGANPCRPPIRWMNTGSSPRMRGKLGHRHRRYGRARIIPAHAGQTRPRPRTPVSPTDHPRACGANVSAIFAT